MKDNPLRKLAMLGQSIWLDYIRCDLIVSNELRRLMEKDGLRRMTSNPSIFEAAMSLSAHHEEIKNSEPKEQHKHELGVIHDQYSCNKNCETKN